MTGVFRNRWWVVFATVCALVVGAGPINVFTFGVFLKPITESLGVGRGVFSSALTLHGVIAAFALPVIGWLVDRWGARRILLPGIFVYALATASYALIQASPLVLTFLIFAATGFFGGVGSPIPYAAVIAEWFDRQRGLALGVGMAGVGLGVALMPQLAAVLISTVGWRFAYVGLALAIVLVAYPRSYCSCANRRVLRRARTGSKTRRSWRWRPEPPSARRSAPGSSGGSASPSCST